VFLDQLLSRPLIHHSEHISLQLKPLAQGAFNSSSKSNVDQSSKTSQFAANSTSNETNSTPNETNSTSNETLLHQIHMEIM